MAQHDGGGSVKAIVKAEPVGGLSSLLLDEAMAAEAPYPCGRCGAFHGNESGYCSACSAGWFNYSLVAKTGRLQRRSYLALVTLVMSYFETSDRLVLSVFVGSTGLIVFFWFLTKSIATAAPAWIAALVLYVVAVLYLIPTIRGTVVTIEDVDKISALFDAATKTCLDGVAETDAGPEPHKCEGEQLVQPTSELRRLYVLARARLAGFEVEVVECLARADREPTEPRETKAAQLKQLFRAREKVAVDYGGRGERLRDVLRASIVCETVGELQTLGDALRALEAAGTVRVLQIKNRFRGHPTPSGYRDVNVSLLYHGFIAELQIHLRAIMSIAERQHVAYEYAREMDLMGVLEKPVEDTNCMASVRRQGITYLVARMVPATLSVVIGWLYVDAFCLRGANLIVKRADLLPTRKSSPPYVLLRVYGLILAAPYWANAFLLCRAAGFFGEKARQQRHEKTRVAMLYERYFGYDGTLFVWKIFCFQICEVALQSFGKLPLFLIWSSPFDCLRATCRNRIKSKSFGKAMSEGRSASFLHAFVIFFFAALLVNVLYPTFLLRTRHVFYQRNFSFIADTVLDVIYALVPFIFLGLGVRSQPMIIPHDPIEYTSNLFPMLHAHFVISVLERAAEERRALRKEAVVTASGVSDKLSGGDDEEGATAAPGAAGDGAVSTSKYAPQLYVALVVACVASWCVAFCAIGLELQITTTAFFFVTSLALPLAARAAGRPSFSTWMPALGLGPVYIAIFWARASPVFLCWALVAHGALVLFSAPETDTGPQTRASMAAGQGRLPRWGAAAYFLITAGSVVTATMLYLSGNAVYSTCQPCECDAKGVLLNCDVFAEAESLTLVKGLNVNAFVKELYLTNKGITEIRPGAFKGLPNLEKLVLKNNKIDGLEPRTFEGLHSIHRIELQRNDITSKAKVKCGALDGARRDDAGINVRVDRDELFCSEYRHISHITPCSCYDIPDQCTTATQEQLDSYYVPKLSDDSFIALSWRDAERYCESPWVMASGSAHLVTIRSEADLDAMNELMGCRDFWIGYDRQGNDTSWKWTSGDASTFEEWGGRGPGASRGGFDCATQSNLGEWYPMLCELPVRYPFVCELAEGSAWTWPTAAPTTIAPSVSPKPTMDLDLPLALAIDGTKDTFYYDAPLWTNDELLDEGGESKTDEFFTPSTTFTVVMRTGSEDRTLIIELSHPKSLKELFSGGYTKTSASLDEWRGLVPNAGYQENCNHQGFNVAADNCYVDDFSDWKCRLRLGIWFNEQNDCRSSDSFVGLGATEWSSGSVCEEADEGQCLNVPSFTRIYVGGVTAPPTFSPEPSRAPTTAVPTSSLAPTSSLPVPTIACGETRTGSTVNEAHWLSGNDAPDHFYLITPSETAYYHFSTCGSSFDTTLYLYHVQNSSSFDSCLREPAPHAGFVENIEKNMDDEGWQNCVFKMPSSSRDDLEDFWTKQELEAGETYVLQVTGHADQECWEDNERDASAAGDYVLSVECADEPVDTWCLGFEWCTDKQLGEDGTGFCNEVRNDLDGYCVTDADCEAKSSCYADCAATPGCDQPFLMCDEGVCHSYILDERCDGQDDDFDLGDGYSCWSDDEGTGWREAHCSMFARMDPPDYSSLDLAFRARDCYEYTEGPQVEYRTTMFLPAITPQDCLDQCADEEWSTAAIISADGSLCECVGGEVLKCYLRAAGTPDTSTIDALAGKKRVCHTRDVDLGGAEYKDVCSYDYPCEGRCHSSYTTMQCDGNGHIWQGEQCDSCDSSGCEPYDLTAQWGGWVVCDPATNAWGFDNDFNGVLDWVSGYIMPCSYDEWCERAECEPSGDVTSSPSGTTNRGTGNGYCSGGLEEWMGCAKSPADCWELCVSDHLDDLVAINWEKDDDSCYCQTGCQCMKDIGDDELYLITRDSAVAQLPDMCDDDDDDDDEECYIETSDDLSSSPSGTTNHGAGNGWCYSELDDLLGCAASPGDCFSMCEDSFGDDLVAIDWGDEGDCYCQHDCECMEDVGDSEDTYLITRDSAVAALPHECGPGEGENADEDEDGDEDEECCVHHTYWADGSLAGTTCPQCCSPFDASTMSSIGNAGCTGYSDAGEVAPPFLDCRQEAIDAGSCGTGHICATCADYGVPTGQYWSFVGYASCPDWVVDALYEDAEDGGNCESHLDEDGDEDDWTDGPAGYCDGDQEVELGETASREECIDACEEAGYEAMAWDTIGGECYCFIEEWCDCVEEYAVDYEDCWCGETDDGFDPEGMSESECAAAGCDHYSELGGAWCECEEAMCASAGGQWQCEAFGPMAFKGFTRGVCDDEDGDEDGDEDDMVCDYDYTHSYGGNSCRGPSACGCGEDSFCNFVDGDSGGCEACSDFDSVSECYYGNDMPRDGKVDCSSCCFPRENPGSYVNPFDESDLAQCFECVSEECEEDATYETICSGCLGEECNACKLAFGADDLEAFVSGGCDYFDDDSDSDIGRWFWFEGCGLLRGCAYSCS